MEVVKNDLKVTQTQAGANLWLVQVFRDGKQIHHEVRSEELRKTQLTRILKSYEQNTD